MDPEVFDGALEPEGDYELMTFADLDLTGQDARGARFVDCALVRCTLDEARLTDARFLDTNLTEIRATTLIAPDTTWRDVTLTDCRLGAVRAHGSELTRVTVRGGKIDYLNLRDARGEDLRFVGATIGDLDLAGCDVRGLVVEDCRIDRLDLTRARLAGADLRGADLRELDGLGGLTGTTISSDQLLELAGPLAAHLGITVV